MGACISRLDAIHHGDIARRHHPEHAEAIWRSLNPLASPPAGFLSIQAELGRFISRVLMVPHNTALRAGSSAAQEVPLALTALLRNTTDGLLDDTEVARLFLDANDAEKLDALATLSRHGLIDLSRKVRIPAGLCATRERPQPEAKLWSLAQMLAHYGSDPAEGATQGPHLPLDDRLRMLRDCGVNLDEPVKKDAATLLHCAVRSGNPQAIAALLALGAQPNARNEHGLTPLMLAASTPGAGKAQVAQALIDGGADMELPVGTQGSRAAHFAASHNQADIIRALANAGADLSSPHFEYYAPIHAATEAGSCDALRALLEAGCDPESTIRLPNGAAVTPVMLATLSDRPEPLRVLAEGGANLSPILGEKGHTALQTAVIHKNHEALKALLDLGCNPDAIDRHGNTALHFAATGDSKEHTNMTRALVKAGANLDIKNEFGDTPVRIAGARGNSNPFDVLIAAGAKGPYHYQSRGVSGGI